MAEGWEVTNRGRIYTFSLRKGWPSHAGNEFTAADVKWAFDRSFALHGITSFHNTLSTIERPEDVKVLDKYTVRIELAEPGPDLLLTLSTFWRVIADSKASEEPRDLRRSLGEALAEEPRRGLRPVQAR
jgi:peptide/nickel transport system substrate-binding protein